MADSSKYRFLTMAALPSEADYVKSIAHERGISLSAFLRLCVTAEIERMKQRKPPPPSGEPTPEAAEVEQA